MKIKALDTYFLSAPLPQPVRTSTSTISRVSELIVTLTTDAGLVGMRFNTIGVSHALSMGTAGMSYSLQSRDLIADSIETVLGAPWHDPLHTIPGRD